MAYCRSWDTTGAKVIPYSWMLSKPVKHSRLANPFSGEDSDLWVVFLGQEPPK